MGFVVPEWTALAVGCAPSQENQNITNPVTRGQDGNTRRSVASNATTAQRPSCLTSANATGHIKIAERPCCRYSILDDPSSFLTRLEPALFRGPSPTSPFPSFALDQALLPVWPSTRRLWPPPCSVLTVRIAGEKGLPVRMRNCWSVQRGRGRVAAKPLRARHGLGSPECPRQPTFGGCGRRSAILRWRAACCGHHFGVCNSG